MARPKSAPKPAPGPEKPAKAKRRRASLPEPEPAEGRVTVVNLKGSAELRAWLVGISEETMIPAAAIVRAGLRLWAAKAGHPEPPRA